MEMTSIRGAQLAGRRGREPNSRDHVLVDASVLVEIMTSHRWEAEADRLLNDVSTPRPTTLLTASHGPIEATHALRRLTRHGAISDDQADLAVASLLALDLVLDPPGARLPRAWELRHTMTTYDAIYAAAAEALRLPLITTDERLLRACGAVGVPAIHLRDAFPA